MRKYLKKISRVFIMEWSKSLQYRVDVVLWMLAEAAIPLVALAIWYAVAKTNTSLSPTDILTW